MSFPSEAPPSDRRAHGSATDRRKTPTRPWDALFRAGRRAGPRRDAERKAGVVPFVDRYPKSLGIMAFLVLVLTLLDGVFTVLLVGPRIEEGNPLMAWFLSRSVTAFLVAKYVLTTLGISFLVVFQAYPMFGSRFRVGHIVPILLALYLLLLGYQTVLFLERPDPDGLAASGNRN